MRLRYGLPTLLAALLGGAAWLAWGGGEPASSGASRAISAPQAPPPEAAPAAPESAGPTPVAGVPSPSPGGRAAPSAALEAPPSDAAVPVAPLAAAAARAAERPVLSGRVVDASGEPVSGAEVLLTPNAGRTRWALDSAEFQRRYARRIFRSETDDSGRFALRGPVPGLLRLALRASGHAPYDRDDLVLPAGEGTDLGDLRLDRAVPLAGRVVDPSGIGVAGAALHWIPPERDFTLGRSLREVAVPLTRTASDGTFLIDRLGPGPWKLLIVTGGFPDRIETGVSPAGRGPMGGLVFRLAPGASIRGLVVGRPDDGRDRALVVRATPTGVQRRAVGQSSAEFREADVGGDGSFEVRGLGSEGTYDLRVRRAEDERPHPTWLSARVEAHGGDAGVVLELAAEASLTFRVTDAATGEPLPDFEVFLGGTLDSRAWRRRLFESEGSFELDRGTAVARIRAVQATGPSSTSLEVRAAGYTSLRRLGLRLDAGAELDLGVLPLEPLPRARVTVRESEGGAPIATALVHSVNLQDDSRPPLGEDEGEGLETFSPRRSTAVTDTSGEASVPGVAGRTVLLWATHPDFAPGDPLPVAFPESGAPEVELALSAGARVTVRVTDAGGAPLAGRTALREEYRSESGVEGWRRSGGVVSLVTGDEGAATFEHLRAGAHRFGVVPPGGSKSKDREWVECTLVDGEARELELVSPAVFALSGRVTEAGYPLAGARLWLHAGHRRGYRRSLMGPRLSDPGTRTALDGSYEVANVTTGDYLLVVDHPSRAMAGEVPISFDAEGSYELDVDLSIARVEGRVTGPAGEPVGGLSIAVLRARDARRLRSVAFARDERDGRSLTISSAELEHATATDADGRYALRGVLPGEDLVVVARGAHVRTRSSARFRVPLDQVVTGVDLVVQPAGELRVRVIGADGALASNVSVRANHRERGDRRAEPHHDITGARGEVVLSGLAPGEWRVRVSPRGGGEREDWGELERVVEVAARRRAEIRFELP